MALRLQVAVGLAGTLLAAVGCNAPGPRMEPRVTQVVHDAPELRAALIQIGWDAAAPQAPGPLVRFADVAAPRGDEIIVAWERPGADSGPRAACAVYRIDPRTGAVQGIAFDAAGDAFDGGLAAAIDVRDVNGDYHDDLIVRRREGDDVVVHLYAGSRERFECIGTARGHRVELRDLDGDHKDEVLVSRVVGEGISGFPEILCQDGEGRLAPAVKRYDGVMPDETKAYIEHVRQATQDPRLRALALRSAAAYLGRLGHTAEAALLEREAGFVAPPAPDPAVSRPSSRE